jgi:hypothetical protein
MRPHMPAPLAFSDEQLDAILRAAGPLAPGDRTGFLEEIAAKLDGQPLGDGIVFKTIRETQLRYLDRRQGQRADGSPPWTQPGHETQGPNVKA